MDPRLLPVAALAGAVIGSLATHLYNRNRRVTIVHCHGSLSDHVSTDEVTPHLTLVPSLEDDDSTRKEVQDDAQSIGLKTIEVDADDAEIGNNHDLGADQGGEGPPESDVNSGEYVFTLFDGDIADDTFDDEVVEEDEPEDVLESPEYTFVPFKPAMFRRVDPSEVADLQALGYETVELEYDVEARTLTGWLDDLGLEDSESVILQEEIDKIVESDDEDKLLILTKGELIINVWLSWENRQE